MTICGHTMSSCSLKQILMRGREKQTESQVVLFFIFFWTLITCPWIIIDGSPVNGLKTEIHLGPSYFQLTGDTVPASSSKDLQFCKKLCIYTCMHLCCYNNMHKTFHIHTAIPRKIQLLRHFCIEKNNVMKTDLKDIEMGKSIMERF